MMKNTMQSAMSHYQSGQLSAAEEICRKIIISESENIQALHMLGTIAAQSGRYDEAAKFLTRTTQIKKDDPNFFYDLGLVYYKWGKLGDALINYKKVISLKPDYAKAHISIGKILKEQGMIDSAIKSYKKAIILKPEPADAYNNLGIIFDEQKNFNAAAEMYIKAISLNPGFAEARFNLAKILIEQKKIDEAIVQYAQVISLKPNFTDAYINLANILKGRGMFNETVMLYEQVAALHPDNAEYLAELVHCIHHACAWDKLGVYETRLLDMVRHDRKGIHPFKILATSANAQEQLNCARLFSGDEESIQGSFSHNPKKADDRIKIGYLSTDFYSHATAHLMAELFERHDRTHFNITGYSYGPDDNSDIRKRLIKSFDKFTEMGNLSDHAAAQKIYEDDIDILIDLNVGLMKGARMGIPARRPSPIQVSYIGYPGTTGVSFIDYIIADRFIIPEDHEQFYSEKVVCLPNSYQPNDTHREIAKNTPTRDACGLPEQGFVFCCFNGNFKITPQIFDIWMRLLKKISGSVLWLLETNLSVKGNLKLAAECRGIDPARLIFAPKISTAENLARYRLADLFIDTLPVNAHTTTSDALWAGLPVLTCVGATFAGRVAGSLIKAAHLHELITYSLEEYEAVALRLAQNPAELATIRDKLQKTRLQVPLFDIENYVKHIEKAYHTMWEIWQAGERPKGFTVA